MTISFGLRNTSDTEKALREALRVTKKGGRVVIAEFSSPTWAPFRKIYTNYLMRALPAIAKKTSSNPDAYIYLAESIRAWPNQKALAAKIEAAGLDRAAAAAALDEPRYDAVMDAELAHWQDQNISGVPAFIVNGKYMIPGAQDVETFVRVLDRILEKEAA